MTIKHFCILFLLVCAYILSSTDSKAQTNLYDGVASPKHEVRAVWLTTLNGLDWPRHKARTSAQVEVQKRELTDILDKLQKAHINTVLMQTRIRGSVIYPSKYEPWDECITGEPGMAPAYDPLAFAVEECHKRGMELHTWVVSIPLGKLDKQKHFGSRSVTRQHPKLCKQVGGEWFMIPGHPETADYIASICQEIAQNYDIDGISLDYIRYPESLYKFSDKEFYKSGNGLSFSEWKRENIDRIVRAVHDKVKGVKPWVKLSSSPIGKYNDLRRQSSGGWNCYTAVSQDPKLWLERGWQDLLFPMMYFQGKNYYPFLCDWAEGSHGHPVAAGLGIYFLDPHEGRWTLNEVRQEIHATRFVGNGGVCFYRSDFFTRNVKGLYDNVCFEFFPHPALQPQMTWASDRQAPSTPTRLHLNGNTLSWNPSTDNSTTVNYTVYGWFGEPEEANINNAADIITTAFKGNECDVTAFLGRNNNFAVTASDRFGNESRPAILHLGEIQRNPLFPDHPRMLHPDSNGLLHVDGTKTLQGLRLESAQGKTIRKSKSRSISALGLRPGWYRLIVVRKKGESVAGELFIDS
ncbi:MAG: family 10 glycosylhydrolase, partial [Bacteroidaceae bacterium]|nr:family 10 glycosylhydrolase [Bacteroidaceae bacterium]